MDTNVKHCPLCKAEGMLLLNGDVKCANVKCALSMARGGITFQEWQSRPIEDELHEKLSSASNELHDTQFNTQVEQLRQRYAKGSYVCAGDVLLFQELARRYRNLINALKDENA